MLINHVGSIARKLHTKHQWKTGTKKKEGNKPSKDLQKATLIPVTYDDLFQNQNEMQVATYMDIKKKYMNKK